MGEAKEVDKLAISSCSFNFSLDGLRTTMSSCDERMDKEGREEISLGPWVAVPVAISPISPRRQVTAI